MKWLLWLALPGLLVAQSAPLEPNKSPGSDDSVALDELLPKILWHSPAPMTADDWICGPGGCSRTPKPPFEFVREDLSGTDPKVEVKDTNGLTWNIKFGAEVIPECFAPRFLMAAGYFGEPTYFIAGGTIRNVGKLLRAGRIINNDGAFRKGRFELRGQSDFVFLQNHNWAWNDNPFRGSHELAGLKIVMMLLSNWDAKDARDPGESNNAVFRTQVDGKPALVYSVFDWGASLGRWGGMLRREQSECSGYVRDTPSFVKRATPDRIEFGFIGKHGSDITGGITPDDVRWLLPYLRRITTEQLQTGLKASGATVRQAGCWAAAIENRIRQLQAAVQSQP